VNEKEIAVARVYARSMLGLAEQRGEAEALLEELRELAAELDSLPELTAFLASPFIDRERKGAVIEKLLRGSGSDLLVDSLQVINRKRRLSLIAAIAMVFRLEYEKAHDVEVVNAVTAVPLTQGLRERVMAAAEGFTGKRVRLEERVDPGLIGGLVLEIGDQKLDSSVSVDLERLHRSMLERAAVESRQPSRYVEETGAE